MDNALGAALEHEHHDIDAGIEAYKGSAETADRVESLTRAVAALRRHIYLEETFLFPPLRPLLAVPTIVMLREHGELWRLLDGLEVQLHLGQNDESVLETCDELLALLNKHNSKEEPIFYTQADSGLTPPARDELTAFLESGRMPAGWACQKAGD